VIYIYISTKPQGCFTISNYSISSLSLR